MGIKANILVVEDDECISKLFCAILEKENYKVRVAYSGSEGQMCIEQFKYDLILLDLMLPGVTGEELISKIRTYNNTPIIVISAKSNQDEKINVLKIGADDFISKPFDINEVSARIEVQLRRHRGSEINSVKGRELNYKNIVLNTDSRQAFINKKEIYLTLREFEILKLLMINPNKVFSKANLFESVWESEFLGDDNTINVHISNLRSKLFKADNKIEYIKTVWGIGFKLNAE